MTPNRWYTLFELRHFMHADFRWSIVVRSISRMYSIKSCLKKLMIFLYTEILLRIRNETTLPCKVSIACVKKM